MDTSTSDLNHQLTMDLGGSEPAAAAFDVPGLRYEPEFISNRAESGLLSHVDASVWRNDLSRRVQHYGWRYDYRSRKVTRDSYLGPLPDWLDELAAALSLHLAIQRPDQVIVNEYMPGQGIARHTDCEPCFGPDVAMMSLGSDIEMDFAGPHGERVPKLLQRRSLLVLSGAARSKWSHEIPKRRTDRAFGVTRSRRVSLTFRTVIIDPD